MPLRPSDIFTPTPRPTPRPGTGLFSRPATGLSARPAAVPPPLPQHVLPPLVAAADLTPGPTPAPGGKLTFPVFKRAMFGRLDTALTPMLQREVRVAFQAAPLADQIALIGEYIKEQIHSIDTFIMLNWKDSAHPAPSAAQVWQVILEKHSFPNAQLINACFPKLRSTASAVQSSAKPEPSPAEGLADNLNNLFEFWARRLYCYDQFGGVSRESVLSSPARAWGRAEWAKIDESAGLPGLGSRIHHDANFLASIVDQLVFK